MPSSAVTNRGGASSTPDLGSSTESVCSHDRSARLRSTPLLLLLLHETATETRVGYLLQRMLQKRAASSNRVRLFRFVPRVSRRARSDIPGKHPASAPPDAIESRPSVRVARQREVTVFEKPAPRNSDAPTGSASYLPDKTGLARQLHVFSEFGR